MAAIKRGLPTGATGVLRDETVTVGAVALPIRLYKVHRQDMAGWVYEVMGERSRVSYDLEDARRRSGARLREELGK